MTRPTILAGAAALALLAAGVAAAQPPPGGGVREACAADTQKLCPDAKPGPGGGMRQCIRSNYASLSDGCKAAIQAMRARREQERQNGDAPAGPPPAAPDAH